MQERIKFPEKFKWGVACASYQIEGGVKEDDKSETIWDRFTYTPGRIDDGRNGDVACDFYHRYKEDIQYAANMGNKVFRLSVCWARILPEGTGRVSTAGVAFYRDVLSHIKECGMEVALTIYHWDLPQCLQNRGGWANREIVDWFLEYAKVLFAEFGDLVDSWITINEPGCIANLGYFTGEHAPGYTDYSLMLQAAHHILLAHGTVVDYYRSSSLTAPIGIVLSMNSFYPARPETEESQAAAKRAKMQLNELYGDPLFKKEYPQELFAYLKVRGVCMPIMEEQDLEIIGTTIDFLDINTYYAEFIDATEGNWPIHTEKIRQGLPVSSAGWEVYPEGMYELLTWITKEYQPQSIIITENGSACLDILDLDGEVKDYDRIDYFRRHLRQIHRCIAEGVPVDGYYVWCLVDNFEWATGFDLRFGLIYMDNHTLERTWKQSAYWYRDTIQQNGFE